MQELMRFFNVLVQVVDYLFKAMTEYRQTPEGAKEWQDIFDAWETAEDAAANPGTFSRASGEEVSQADTFSAASDGGVFRKGVRIK